MPFVPLYALIVFSGVALVVIGPRRLPVAARSAWRFIVEFKRFLDTANREVDDVIKSAWGEFREGPTSAQASRLDTVVVIAALVTLLVVLTIPAANHFCRELLLSILR